MMLVGLAGLAGSGKDTIADWLVKERGFVKLAFANEMKRFVLELFPKRPAREELGGYEIGIDPDWVWGPSEKRGTLFYCDLAPEHDKACLKLIEKLQIDIRHLESLIHWARGVPWVATVREVLQTLGTEWGRNVDPLLWCKDTLNRQLRDVVKPEFYGWDPAWGDAPPRIVKGVVITDVRFDNEAQAIRDIGGVVWKIERGVKTAAGGIPQHASENGVDPAICDVVLNTPEGLDKLAFFLHAIYSRQVWCKNGLSRVSGSWCIECARREIALRKHLQSH